jgi:hypothetical protein
MKEDFVSPHHHSPCPFHAVPVLELSSNLTIYCMHSQEVFEKFVGFYLFPERA